ncbi:hypothetical protein NDA10_007577 [Ustilago hordei]|nr:hypothetical protein NDA10_007577 [Ustilago hordei]
MMMGITMDPTHDRWIWDTGNVDLKLCTNQGVHDSDNSSLTSAPSTASLPMEEDALSDFQVEYLTTAKILTSLTPAQASLYWPKWEEAINIKLNSLINTGTWTIVNLPQGCKPILARWVFKMKHDADNNISKFKAQLVACGYSQVHSIDYHNTYSPVVSMTCLQMVMCYSIKHSYRICQLNFVATYLNSKLKDVDIYMVLLPGFKDHFKQSLHSVCNLKKALYGLKQSS